MTYSKEEFDGLIQTARSREEFIEMFREAREQLSDPKDVEYLDQLIAGFASGGALIDQQSAQIPNPTGYVSLVVPPQVKEELAQLRAQVRFYEAERRALQAVNQAIRGAKYADELPKVHAEALLTFEREAFDEGFSCGINAAVDMEIGIAPEEAAAAIARAKAYDTRSADVFLPAPPLKEDL